MEITLHLGAHRTASSSLQCALERARPKLRRRGVGVWGPSKLRKGMLAGVYGDPGRLTVQRARLLARARGRVAVLSQEAGLRGIEHIVISDENLLGALRENIGLARLYPTARLRGLRASAGLGDVDTVTLAIRDYDRFWASSMAFLATRGFALPDAEALRGLSHVRRRWRDVICDVAEAFPKARLVVWSYEALGAQPTLLASWMTRVALRQPDPHMNAALSGNALRMRLRADGLDVSAMAADPGPFMPFDLHQRRDMHAVYCADIAWLRAGADGMADYLDQDFDRLGVDPAVALSRTDPRGTFATEGTSHDQRDSDRPDHALG